MPRARHPENRGDVGGLRRLVSDGREGRLIALLNRHIKDNPVVRGRNQPGAAFDLPFELPGFPTGATQNDVGLCGALTFGNGL